MMAQQHLRKYAWLVFLMAFVIGWSGVSAAANPMQHAMPVMQMSHDMSSMPCHQMTASAHEHLDASDQVQCHQNMMTTLHQSNDHCPDCNPSHCQVINLAVQQLIPELEPQFIPTSVQFSSVYQAQHLAGHWQEILRPPKA